MNSPSKTYRSAVSLGIAIPVAVLLLGLLALMAANKLWAAVASLGVGIAVLAAVFAGITYTIGGGVLRIRVAFVRYGSVPIASITRVAESRNPLSAPAASLDRLEVFYGKYDSVLISPKDKAGFIAHLLQINPAIVVAGRKRALADRP